MARADLKMPKPHPPKFHFIGLSELVDLLNKLVEISPSMLHYLCGDKGVFTYDSPKFVEAVIRLARGDIPRLACHPIIRVDDDATVQAPAIDKLLNVFSGITQQYAVYFLSGRYGRSDGEYDPMNDHAVRVHWFYPPGTRAGDPRFHDAKDEAFVRGNKQSRMFLADMGELGAVEILEGQLSRHMRDWLKKHNVGEHENKEPQVISGAGLILSRRAIVFLPPFMNLQKLTVWVDDHLKRRLHETIGDVVTTSQESVKGAVLQQDRHPGGTSVEDAKRAESDYFDRLVRGCMLDALITGRARELTPYSQAIKDMAWYKRNAIDAPAWEENKPAMRRLLEVRYDQVLHCWMSPEFNHTLSYQWAKSKQTTHSHKTDLCEQVLRDAESYLNLLYRWPAFVRAIERLRPSDNDWLYERADG